MSYDHDPDFEDWKQRAHDATVLDVAQRLGANLKRVGTEWVGPCPTCGGTDRFSINTAKNVFNCRQSGDKGGDAIAMVMHVLKLEFVPACEVALGEPPPRRNSTVEPRPVDHDAERMAVERQRDNEIARREAEAAARAKKKTRAQEIFDSGVDLSGTLLARYLKARGLTPMPEQREFIRFIPSHPYYHGEDADGRPIRIGEWPAMVALMREAHGDGEGLHCTYLDPAGLKKLDHSVEGPDGKMVRLNPRKMYGTKGLIWLSPPRPFMVIGEGIETVLSWYEIHTEFEDVGIAAAGDLGNMCGGALDKRPHPRRANMTIPWGDPAPDKPGFPVPDGVSEILLLGDADTDEANVRANLLIAGRRHRAAGIKVSIAMAPKPAGQKKWDWNDELMARAGNEAAA